jgi:hypothetical protein
MRVTVKGLPPQSLVAIDWANNTVRGYEIGNIRTDADGASIPTSLNLFRSGETRGYKVVLTTEAIDSTVLGTLWPCGSPSIDPAGHVVDPKVTVVPNTALTEGQSVRVSVTGFGQYEKVFLSECGQAEDANAFGCGPQTATQPFIVTGSDRSGSMRFVVHTSAFSMPYNTTAVMPCTYRCVIEAHEGNGAWAVAPVAFGSSQPINQRAALMAKCSQSAVRITTAQGFPSAGHYARLVRIQNTSRIRCTLPPYPLLMFHNVGTSPTYTAGPSSMSSATSVASVVLAPDEIASADFGGADMPVGGASTCPTFRFFTANIALGTPVTFHAVVPDCSGIVVNPFVKGFTGLAPPSGRVQGHVPTCKAAPKSIPGPIVPVRFAVGREVVLPQFVFASTKASQPFAFDLAPGTYRVTSAHGSSRQVTVRAGRITKIGLFGACETPTIPTNPGGAASTTSTTGVS